jgi:hypothetical protein
MRGHVADTFPSQIPAHAFKRVKKPPGEATPGGIFMRLNA